MSRTHALLLLQLINWTRLKYPKSRGNERRRVVYLLRMGLVEMINKKEYVITKRGKLYLRASSFERAVMEARGNKG